MLPPKTRPRHLPTLTHVVTSAEWASEQPVLCAETEAPSENDPQLVQQIVQSLMPTVRARIRESLQELLDDKLHHLEASIQLEVESMVRSAVNGRGGTASIG